MTPRTPLCRTVWLMVVVLLPVSVVGSGAMGAPGFQPEGPDAASPTPTASPTQAPDPRAATVRAALEQGMEVDQADENGRTALMMAAFDGYTEVVSVLLEYGAEIDRVDPSGRTALMYASSGPFPATVELLLENGSNPNLADTVEGWTALMFAAGEGHASVVEMLLRYGTDSSLEDDDGDTAFDHAWHNHHDEVIHLLEPTGE